MQLLVGLGNPGVQYERTRHNVGFMVMDRLAGAGPWKSQFKSQFCTAMLGNAKVYLCKPTTYMNLSGEAVHQVLAYYRLAPSEVLVVCDDFALPLGKLRLREQGSSGGHNGLTSIAQYVGGNEFARLRIGIGPVPPRWDPKDFVLGPFDTTEQELLAKAVEAAADAVRSVVADGVAKAMNRFNGLDLRPQPAEE